MIDFFIDAYREASQIDIILEFLAFLFGIISVYYAQRENILVYPTGIICTTITIYILYNVQYYGDMMMNVYYSVMSVYGWVVWSMKKNNVTQVKISYTRQKDRIIGFIMFLSTMIITYIVYQAFAYDMDWKNYVDIFTSGIFFTAMYYMAIKKVESWVLWIIADAITIPLYGIRGLGMLSLQYLIFLGMAIYGLRNWIAIYRQQYKLAL